LFLFLFFVFLFGVCVGVCVCVCVMVLNIKVPAVTARQFGGYIGGRRLDIKIGFMVQIPRRASSSQLES